MFNINDKSIDSMILDFDIHALRKTLEASAIHMLRDLPKGRRYYPSDKLLEITDSLGNAMSICMGRIIGIHLDVENQKSKIEFASGLSTSKLLISRIVLK